MQRYADSRPSRSADPRFLRPADLLALGFLFALLLLASLAWLLSIPGAPAAAARLAVGIAILLLLRAMPRRGPGDLLAAVAPLGLVPIDWALDPVVDLVTPALRDGALLHADRLLFGDTPSILLEGFLRPWLVDALQVGYLAYFVLLLAPIGLLYLERDLARLDEYTQLLVVFFVTNLSFYLLVPAIGPRFTVASAYAGPLQGALVGDRIGEMFRHAPFFRDCFPSGHTAGTLLMLTFSWRRGLRRYFYVALPFATLCICATVLCRYHYAIDLLCALPLALWSWRAARALEPAVSPLALREIAD